MSVVNFCVLNFTAVQLSANTAKITCHDNLWLYGINVFHEEGHAHCSIYLICCNLAIEPNLEYIIFKNPELSYNFESVICGFHKYRLM